jgi:hypothetical protein
MKPTSDIRSTRLLARAPRLRELFTLCFLLGLTAARADTTNFTDQFGEAFWNMQPQHGSVFFTNDDTELVIVGPNLPTNAIPQSLDGIVYNETLGGGFVVGGTVSFHWQYTSGDALSDSAGEVAWTPPGGTSIQDFLGQGGPGVTLSGNFTDTFISSGTTNFTFLLTTDTVANKLSGTLIITDFQFHNVPEPSTGALLATAALSLTAVRWRQARRRASAQP